MRERIIEFRKLDRELKLGPILGEQIAIPQIDVAYSTETEARFPEIAGGLSVAIARTFRIIDPNVKNPASEQWERVSQLFSVLL